MIVESELSISNLPDDKDALSDLCSGLFNTGFELGNIFGPLVGNAGYVEWGGEDICEYVGYLMMLFGAVYFFGCDDLFYTWKEMKP